MGLVQEKGSLVRIFGFFFFFFFCDSCNPNTIFVAILAWSKCHIGSVSCNLQSWCQRPENSSLQGNYL